MSVVTCLTHTAVNARRLLLYIGQRFSNLHFSFALVAIPLLAAKLCHLLAFKEAVKTRDWCLWGFSMFAQDTLLLVLLRLLLDDTPSSHADRWYRRARLAFGALFSLFVFSLSIVDINFFVMTGTEIHWRHAGFAKDASSRAVLLSGLVSLAFIFGVIFFAASLVQDFIYDFVGVVTNIVSWPFRFLRNVLLKHHHLLRDRFFPSQSKYWSVPQQDVEELALSSDDDSLSTDTGFSGKLADDHPSWPVRVLNKTLTKLNIQPRNKSLDLGLKHLMYFNVTVGFLIQQIMFIAQPRQKLLTLLSWTPVILPFIDFASSSPNLEILVPFYKVGIERAWDEWSALSTPPTWSWMPEEKLDGFGDWQQKDKLHYNAADDPMKISNAGEDVLESIREQLSDVPIRHVVLIFLESTRSDAFPFKMDGMVGKGYKKTWGDEGFPDHVLDYLKNATPTARYITGDYDDGFEHDDKPQRGGLHFPNAVTTATYTLKSLTGTLCGVTPFTVDFNKEANNHIYQPCLAQVFEALNKINNVTATETEFYNHNETLDATLDARAEGAYDFSNYAWRSKFMQTSTVKYDKTEKLLKGLGYGDEDVVSREYLRREDAKFGQVTEPLLNYFSFIEDPLEDYIRDEFQTAQENDERVFISHLTSTTHHPWNLPENETYVKLTQKDGQFSKYMNSEHYIDGWLKKILNALDEEGVADETLVVLQGDHGQSMPEKDSIATYYNPSVGNDHIPVVLSHPKLPAIKVEDPVISMQVLPTILDLLIETGSLSGTAREAASDMMRNYEGQSMIRQMKKEITRESKPKGYKQGDFQFTVVNPGGAVIAVRDVRYPERRIIVPVIAGLVWEYSNIVEDPREDHAVKALDYPLFLKDVEKTHGEEVAKWAEEAAFMTRWFVEDNRRRWKADKNFKF